MYKKFFQAVDAKKGNFNKPPCGNFQNSQELVKLHPVSCQDVLPDTAHSVPEE